MEIRVLLADDHEPTRAALRGVLKDYGEITVVAEASDVESVKRLILELHPDVALLDVRLRGGSGFELAEWIRIHVPTTRTLLASAEGDCQTAQKAIAAGALGFVLKETAFEELASAVRLAATGRVYRNSSLQHGGEAS